jgi:cell division septal protein FtsQ
MTEDWPVKAFWFFMIFFIVGGLFTWWFSSIMPWPLYTIAGFSIGLIGAASFVGVALRK